MQSEAAARVAAGGDRHSRRHALMVAAGATLLLGLVAAMAALPWVAGVASEVRHSYTPSVPDQNRGTYLVTPRGAMQLYAWNIDPGLFPVDAPELGTGAVQEVVVVLKQHGPPADYQLFDLDAGTVIGWAGATASGMQLRLVPDRELEAGRYMLLVPTDSMFGGQTRHYFSIGAQP